MKGLRERDVSNPHANTLTTSLFATFDPDQFYIPPNSIIGFGVCFGKDKYDTFCAKDHYEGDYLKAIVNTVNGIILERKCSAFFTLLSDTIDIPDALDQNYETCAAAGHQYLSQNTRYFNFEQNSVKTLHTQWNDWREDSVLSNFRALFEPLKRKGSREQRSNTSPEHPTNPSFRKDACRKVQSKSAPTALTPLSNNPSPSNSPPRDDEISSFGDTVDIFSEAQSVKATTTSFEEFKAIFDDTSRLADDKNIGTIEPTYSLAREYIIYMYNNPISPNHKKFKAFADEVVARHVKIDRHHKKNKEKIPEEEINMDTILTQMRSHLIDECAQYLVMGIYARKFQKPIRILHEGNNEALRFIENDLIGQLPSRALALQITEIQYVSKSKEKKFFTENPSFFNPNRSRETSPNSKRHLKNGAVTVPPAQIIISVSIYLQRPETTAEDIRNMITLLDPAIEAKKARANTVKDATSKSYTFSSPRPAFDELISHLLAFFYAEETTLESLESFRQFLESRLALSSEQNVELKN